MKTITRTIMLVCFTAALAGCGKSEAEKEAEEAGKSGRGEVTCSGTAIADPGLPAGFPSLEGATYTEERDDGPTHVVNGYVDKELGDVYEGYRDGFESAGWNVTFDEKEKDDAEVAYESADEQTTGIVALRVCEDGEDRVSLHITARPK